jgi:hypothetical protein
LGSHTDISATGWRQRQLGTYPVHSLMKWLGS